MFVLWNCLLDGGESSTVARSIVSGVREAHGSIATMANYESQFVSAGHTAAHLLCTFAMLITKHRCKFTGTSPRGSCFHDVYSLGLFSCPQRKLTSQVEIGASFTLS